MGALHLELSSQKVTIKQSSAEPRLWIPSSSWWLKEMDEMEMKWTEPTIIVDIDKKTVEVVATEFYIFSK